MGTSRVRLLVASILVAVTVRPAASDSCAEAERDERQGMMHVPATKLNACGTECVSIAKHVLYDNLAAMYNASDGWATTAPVGSFPGGASPFGVLDMAGNVSEWTSPVDDRHAKVCGGGWLHHRDEHVKAESCNWVWTGYRDNLLGFRCARDE